MPTAEDFLELETANQVAAFFGKTYKEISEIFYQTPKKYKYRKFEVNKRSGGTRIIYAPNKKIKEIQQVLAQILLEIYKQKPSVHGFCRNRSIVTNAKQHLNKKHIFNIDIQDFFPSIHFGRVKYLFAKAPFSLPHSAATVLAHICCFDNMLPQGAPTSPIISNLICRKLDTSLQELAKKHSGTYTRYADDISFSFTCRQNRLPRDIIIVRPSGIEPGEKLVNKIEENGFKINNKKSRLCTGNNRFEVTGITVNEFPNVRRAFVQQIKSMIYAWEEHGYEKAEIEFHSRWYFHNRGTDQKASFKNVVRGKLLFLHMVRGDRDKIYINLAKRFNKLIPAQERPLPYVEATDEEKDIFNTLWVLETLYDDEHGEIIANHGTGFMLKDVGLVTCAHVVAKREDIHKITEAFRHDRPHEKYTIKVTKFSVERDLAIVELCSQTNKEKVNISECLLPSPNNVKQKDSISLYGFPAYKTGQTPYVADGKVASKFATHGIQKFEITTPIREGNSGGPVLNMKNEVIGIAAEGARKESGNNAVISIGELSKVPEVKK
ncbi:MAG: reverse transcriptase domain-containing protein [Candidatus Electrothrix sp. GW3-4]|uniref:reverse transcriptase domain-containing protein n=1 Tax=Candidatus Electrothrix sp. GW3-4 TaxID=3126740 RepID=UPI0030D5278A